MGKKLQKPYPADYKLLTTQDSRQVRYEMLVIISLKEFIKLNVNTIVKDDLIKYKCLCCNKNYQKKVYENLKKAIS